MALTQSNNNAAAAALATLANTQPSRSVPGLLVWRAELLPKSSLLAPLLPPPIRRLLDACFHRRFCTPASDLRDLVSSTYSPGVRFENNLATVAGVENVAAAMRFLSAPFVSISCSLRRVEVVAWAPDDDAKGGLSGEEAAAAAAAGREQAMMQPPPLPTEEEDTKARAATLTSPAAGPLASEPRPPPSTASLALIVETDQRWRLAGALVLVRAVFGEDVRVRVRSALRLDTSTGRVSGHADAVEAWATLPRVVRGALGLLAPLVVTALGW